MPTTIQLIRFPARLLSTALVLLTVAFSTSAAAQTGQFRLVTLDVGQGDAAVVITPSGCAALLDAGQTGSGTVIKSYLRSIGITHLDFAVISHFHEDHLGGIDEVEQGSDAIRIDRVYDHGGSYNSAAFRSYDSQFSTRRVTAAVGQTISLCSEVSFLVVASNANGVSTSDENARSVAVRLSYGPFDAMVGGDLTGSSPDMESRIASSVGPVEVYKVHHHGSAGASNATFLGALQPLASFISVGLGNTYNHPTASALSRLQAVGTDVWQTEDVAANVKLGHLQLSSSDGGRTFSIAQGATSRRYVSKGVDAQAPSVPASLAAVARSTSQIDLSWTASTDNTGVAGYHVFWSGDGHSFKLLTTTTSTRYSDTGLPPLTTLWYAVSAFDAMGNESAISGSASATTADMTPPTLPGNLRITQTTASNISLAWTASTDDTGVTGYRILRDGVRVTTTTGTSFVDVGLKPDETHAYTVTAVDGAGNLSPPAMASGTTTCAVAITTMTYKSKYLTVKATSSQGGQGVVTLSEKGVALGNLDWSPTSKVWSIRKYRGTQPQCVTVTASCGGVATSCF